MISIIIPVREPEPYLDTLTSDIHKILKGRPHEILVQTEHGLGNAVSCGVQNSKGNIIVILDADGSHDPEEIPYMLYLLNGYHIVVGSKRTKGGKSEDSFSRRHISSIYNRLTTFLLKTDVKDPMSGFIVTLREVFDNYNFPSGYKFMLPLYTSNKFFVTEHPITFHKRKEGKSKTSFLEGFRTLYIILKLCSYMVALALVSLFERSEEKEKKILNRKSYK